MHRRMLGFALSTVFSTVLATGVASAAPQDPPPPPSAQDQSAPPADQGGPPPDAAGPGRQGPTGERMAQMMAKRLNLSADQQSQIQPILADQMSQMMGVRNDTSLAPRDRMQKMRSIQEDSNAKIKAILTPEQRPQFDAMQQQMRDRMRQRRQGMQNGGADNAPPPPDNTNQ